MDKSRTSVSKWLLVMYLVSSTKQSINAVHLSRIINVTYKTAWSMLRKVRAAITDADRHILLSGIVEAKPGIYMRQEVPSQQNLDREHALIIARTNNAESPSYYKMKMLRTPQKPRKAVSDQARQEFVDLHTSPGNNVILLDRKYRFIPIRQEPLPTVYQEAVWWMNRTFYGLSVRYVQHYLDEYCFRKNYGSHPFQAFNRLIGICITRDRAITV